jgi:hypothetical protein
MMETMRYPNPGVLGTGDEAWGQSLRSSERRDCTQGALMPGKGVGVIASAVKIPAGSRLGPLSGGVAMVSSLRRLTFPLVQALRDFSEAL